MKRGNLLWTGSRMMLSEHRQLLNQRHKEQYTENDIQKEIDEQQLDLWQQTLEKMAKRGRLGILVVYGKGAIQVEGELIAWDSGDNTIYIKDKEGDRIKIPYHEIQHIEGLDI